MKLIKNTIGHLLLDRVKKNPSDFAIGSIQDGLVQKTSFEQYRKMIEGISLALAKNGLVAQDKVGILSDTRMEWNVLDLAIMSSGAITVPVYHTYKPEEIKFILNQTQTKIVIVEDEKQLQKVSEVLGDLKEIKMIITLDKVSSELSSKVSDLVHLVDYKSLTELGVQELNANPDVFEAKVAQTHEQNIATIVYTSGTTGEPKGAVITHGALIAMLFNIKSFAKTSLTKNDISLVFLPLSHVLGRCDSLLNLNFGCLTVYAESIDKLFSNISLVRPTFMIAVPRIFEKIFEKVQLDLESSGIVKKSLFNWAMDCTNNYYNKIEKDKTPDTLEILQFNLAKKLVTDKIYQKFGGRIRYFISGGAPISKEIIFFLRNSGLTLIEGYGLTETIAPCVLNPFEKQRGGTVGKPVGDVEVKFLEDGEILIRSKALFKEYYQNQKETDAALDSEGWFKTGDLGSFDENGYLQITGRKKDIIVTSAGKNVAPQKIENILKLSPSIDQVVVVGDRQKFLSALITVDKASFDIEKWDEVTIEKEQEVVDFIQKEIDKVNSDLASFETIKKFKLIKMDLSTDNYLTPSLKVKKKLLIKDYADDINSLYQD